MLRLFEKHVARFWSDSQHFIRAWPTLNQPAVAHEIPHTSMPATMTGEGHHDLSAEVNQQQARAASEIKPLQSWLQISYQQRQIQPDNYLSDELIRLILRHRWQLGYSEQSTAATVRVELRWVRKYLSIARGLRLNWELVQSLHPEILRQVMIPAARPGARAVPDYEHIHQQVINGGSTLHREWLAYACANHKATTYRPAQFYARYHKWVEAQTSEARTA